MSAVMGFVGGVAGLALLDAAITSPQNSDGTTVASNDLSGAFGLFGKFLQIIIDPTRPGIADHTKTKTTSIVTTAAITTGPTSGAKGSKSIGPLNL